MAAPHTPSDDDIRAFLLGLLPQDAAERTATWLESDPAAADRLAALDDGLSDDLLAAVATTGSEGGETPAAAEELVRRVTAAIPPTETPVPDRIGDYRVTGRLGTGGMGVVYAAHDDGLDRAVAIKVLAADRAADPVARARFVREGKAAAAIDCPHVIKVHGVGDDGGTPYLVMELVPGTTLSAWLEKHTATPADAVRVARGVLTGLASAQAKKFVHRDIKPSNLWVCADGRVKLLDFGLTRDPDAAEVLTHDGATVGTPAYMAPEQAKGRFGPRSDLFSLGAVLYEMFAGRAPFHREGKVATLQALANDDPPPLPPGVPPPLSAFIFRLLARDPADRPASAAAATAELNAVEAALGKPARRRRAVWVLAAVVVAAAIGLAIYLSR